MAAHVKDESEAESEAEAEGEDEGEESECECECECAGEGETEHRHLAVMSACEQSSIVSRRRPMPLYSYSFLSGTRTHTVPTSKLHTRTVVEFSNKRCAMFLEDRIASRRVASGCVGRVARQSTNADEGRARARAATGTGGRGGEAMGRRLKVRLVAERLIRESGAR